MLDFLYTLFIAPLEYWMHKVLVWGQGFTQDWGLAIIVMSLVVNVVILPIYIKAESWQEAEQKIRLGFAAKEAMIRRAFRGQERFAMLTAMRRQAGYTTFISMRSSVGFFLQIPFFFAAYHFLSHFEPIVGVPFLGLSDLGRPDECFFIGSFPVNFMPILMTVINIASALIYTKNLARRDKIQLYAMAALFLVLLYDAASGLVLYWTCNNIFSLGKNIVYDVIRKVRGRLPWQKNLQERPLALSRVPRVLAGILLVAWIAGFAFTVLASDFAVFLDAGTRLIARHAAAFAFCVSVLVSGIVYSRVGLWRNSRPAAAIAFALVAGFLYFYLKGDVLGTKHRYFELSASVLAFLAAVPAMMLAFDAKSRVFFKADVSSLYIPSAYWAVILLTGYLPIQAYCTAPEMFSSPDVVLARLLGFSACLTLLLWGLYVFARWTKTLASTSFFLTFFVLVATVFAFLLPMDVGTIESFTIQKTEKLFLPVNAAIDLGVIAAVGAALFWFVRRGYVNFVRTLVVTACVAAIFAAGFDLASCRGRWVEDSNSRVTTLPSYNDRFFGFSKTGQNVLIVVLDMFTGHHMRVVLKEKPELRRRLEGFVWYPDTLAQGYGTLTSIMTLVCGEDCEAEDFNDGSNLTLAEKANRMYARKIDSLSGKFDVSIQERTWMEPHLVRKFTSKDALVLRYMGNAYMNRYAAQENLDLDVGSSDDFLAGVSLFKAVPWSWKRFAYLNGRWITRVMQGSKANRSLAHVLDLALLHELPEISNALSQRDTYKFLHLELTHRPWMATSSCTIAREPAADEDAKLINEGHLNCEICSLELLADWFDWMKRQGVYDNTSIVIASDHGERPYGRFNALLLAKPWHAPKRPLSTDENARMQLTDVPLIALGKAPRPGADRIRHFFNVSGSGPTEFDDLERHEVTGPYFEKDSWDEVTWEKMMKDYERITEDR